MKRKLIACLLSVTMLCSLFPTFALATSADEDPTGTLSVICPVCETENCTEHTPCATCGEYNCNVDHSVMPASDPETCTTCGQADCDGQHENWCDICKMDNCGVDHSTPETCTTCNQPIADCTCGKNVTTCEKCGKEDCTSDHTNWCETCKKDDCGIDHSTPQSCPTCGAENCESDHTNWCETCKKDDCGIDHSVPQPCTTCGQTDCSGVHENWCETCQKDNCGKTAHVYCETCQDYDCGIPEHAIMPADEGGEGDEITEPSFCDTLLNASSLSALHDLMTNEENNEKISALTLDQLRAVKAKAVEHYNNDSDHSATDDYQYNYLCGKIDNLIVKKDSSYLTEFLSECECGTGIGVHEADCPAYIPLPAANVTELNLTSVPVIGETDEKPLTYAMEFATRTDYTDLQKAYYGDWIADFVITTNKAINGDYACLAGQYDAYNQAIGDDGWVYADLSGMGELPANVGFPLITSITDWEFPFEGIIDFIPSFKCGIWVSPDYLANNPDFSVTVELQLFPTDSSGKKVDDMCYPICEINYQQDAIINYVAGANGTVDVQQETVGTLVHPNGATPTAAEGYHFAGWYTADAEGNYTVPVSSEWVDAQTGKLTPGTNASDTYDSATYYAKFDLNTVDLKFELSGGKSSSTYLFTLTGEGVSLRLAVKGGESITIQDLPAGEYTITPDNNWNWRETVSVTGSGNLTQDATAAVTVTSNGKKQWFNGYAYDKN